AQWLARCGEPPLCQCRSQQSCAYVSTLEARDLRWEISGKQFSKYLISAIDHLFIDQACFCGEFMRLGWTRVIDMQHLMPVRGQPIRNQHTMAAEVNAFSAHIGGARMLSHCDQVSDCTLELYT